MLCPYCKKLEPDRGYCCEKAELEVLRTVADEAIRTLDAEAKTIGAIDIQDSLEHVTQRLRAARVRAA